MLSPGSNYLKDIERLVLLKSLVKIAIFSGWENL
ncbi:hypothetical protein PMIT1303_01689 [Prochlorococcus sp. MIT 1303]|nr:hypothetical protein PMIT1303_01689 [Prochlorococcus sp. MIT 1303]